MQRGDSGVAIFRVIVTVETGESTLPSVCKRGEPKCCNRFGALSRTYHERREGERHTD